MAMKSMSVALATAIAAGVGGCGGAQAVRPVPRDAAAFAPWSDAGAPYRLGAGDRLRIDYLMTPELSQDAVVEPDGTVSLRLAGRLAAQDRTAAELETAVRTASAERLRDPVVSVSVQEARSARVVVGGSVQRPGVYPLPAHASVFEAVTLAGGLQPEGRIDQVVVIRRRSDGSTMLRTVDLRRFASTGAADQEVILCAGDLVFVPRSRIGEVNLWIDQYVNRVLPFSRSVSLVGGSETVR